MAVGVGVGTRSQKTVMSLSDSGRSRRGLVPPGPLTWVDGDQHREGSREAIGHEDSNGGAVRSRKGTGRARGPTGGM